MAKSSRMVSSYTFSTYPLDWVFICLFLGIEAFLAWRLLPLFADFPVLAVLAAVFGYVGADFLSGFVHWMGDTWGHAETPVFGSRFILPFREHHVDQKAITRHAFSEVNGNNCLVASLFLGGAIGSASFFSMSAWVFFLLSVSFWLSLGVFVTNQFHKWAHMSQVSPMISFLQKHRFILHPEDHAIHHQAPYDRFYCITTGWLNSILLKTGFFRRIELMVTRVTGAVPREEDREVTK